MLRIACLLVFSGSLEALPWYFEQNRIQDSWSLGIRGDGVEIDLVDSYFVMLDSLKGKVQCFEPLDLDGERLSNVEMMHGTAMVGLIVADQQMLEDVLNPGKKLIVAGIAPGARIRVHPFFNKRFVESMSNAYQTISQQRNARGKALTPEDIDPTRVAVMSVSSGTRSVDGDLTIRNRPGSDVWC